MINEHQAHIFCKDDISKIENYELAIDDKTQTWDLHHRNELTLEGEFAHSREELKQMDMYYNRPYYELIFLTKAEHTRLHNKGRSDETLVKISKSKKGYIFTDEHRRNLSEAHKGHIPGNKGKHPSAESRRKMSAAHKGKEPWNKGKTSPRKGKHWKVIDGKRVWY